MANCKAFLLALSLIILLTAGCAGRLNETADDPEPVIVFLLDGFGYMQYEETEKRGIVDYIIYLKRQQKWASPRYGGHCNGQ